METVRLNLKLRGNEMTHPRENAAKTSFGFQKREKGVIWFPKTWGESFGAGRLGSGGEEGEGIGRNVTDGRDAHRFGDEGVR